MHAQLHTDSALDFPQRTIIILAYSTNYWGICSQKLRILWTISLAIWGITLPFAKNVWGITRAISLAKQKREGAS
jgi:hypothetical protein